MRPLVPTVTQGRPGQRGGFGHLGISVPDVYEASARFAELGYEFTKTPNGGGMKGLAFIKDPAKKLAKAIDAAIGER